MDVVLVAEGELIVGKPIVVEGHAPNTRFTAVFEDDGETGYFYALDTDDKDNPIQDAVHIYNAENVADAHVASKVQIVWSQDGTKTALLINDYPHAVFDFTARRGYCRTNFPPPGAKWPQDTHAWDDAAIRLLK